MTRLAPILAALAMLAAGEARAASITWTLSGTADNAVSSGGDLANVIQLGDDYSLAVTFDPNEAIAWTDGTFTHWPNGTDFTLAVNGNTFNVGQFGIREAYDDGSTEFLDGYGVYDVLPGDAPASTIPGVIYVAIFWYLVDTNAFTDVVDLLQWPASVSLADFDMTGLQLTVYSATGGYIEFFDGLSAFSQMSVSTEAAVPSPAAASLLMFGLFGLAARTRATRATVKSLH